MPSRTVLIIAGSEDERLIWSAILEHYGYVPEAIPLAGTVPDAFAPDLIVVALDRFDSSRATLLSSLRGESRFAGVPIIGIIDPDVHPSEPLRAGCAGVLVRPIRPAALRAEVDRLIGPPRPHRPDLHAADRVAGVHPRRRHISKTGEASYGESHGAHH